MRRVELSREGGTDSQGEGSPLKKLLYNRLKRPKKKNVRIMKENKTKSKKRQKAPRNFQVKARKV